MRIILQWNRCLRPAFFILLLLHCLASQAQVYGCKDPQATNYNAAATTNDGSCQYPLTPYTPVERVNPISNALLESSGLQWAGNHLWSFNDGGNDPVLFRMDTTNNGILQTVILEGATNVDWEDIGFDGTSLYIGDFGNNYGDRTNLKIYKVNLSDIPAYPGNAVVTIPASKIRTITFAYADQNPIEKTDLNKTKYDCEAMLVDGAKIHLFTKNWLQDSTTHYVISDTAAGNYMATRLEAMPISYRVTAADKAPGSNVVLLLGYQTDFPFKHFLQVLSDYSDGFYFNGNKRRIDLPNAGVMGQAEGLTFRSGTIGYISNEKIVTQMLGFDVTINQKLFIFNTNNFIAAAVLPVLLEQFDIKTTGGVHRLQWRFSETVQEANLQVNENGAGFRNLNTYKQNKNGTYQHQPVAGSVEYRLRWKDKNGKEQFSKTISARNSAKDQFSNFVLSADGQLELVNYGSQAADYRLKLVSVDGRTLSGTKQQILFPGRNTIAFSKSLTRNSILLLQMASNREEITRKLWVR